MSAPTLKEAMAELEVILKSPAQRIAEASAYDGAAFHYTNRYGDELHVRFVSGQYNNGRLAIQTVGAEHGEPEAVLTVNFDGFDGLDEGAGEIVVKTWGTNEDFAPAALGTGWFEDTGKRVSNGFVEASIWRVLTRDFIDIREEARAEAAAVMPR